MIRKLSTGQTMVVIACSVPMLAVGGVGAWGTFTNINAEFQRAATAAGVVAAGEGLVLILALVMLLVTMFGQTAPTPVRVGLWLAPVAAAVTGIAVADGWRERVVYAITPLAMSGAAEGLAFVARRIVVYRDGIDMEGQRRNAAAVQALAYQSALAAGHPDKRKQKRAERKAWKLGARVGAGDPGLAEQLLDVQRTRLAQGADTALGRMYAPALAAPEPKKPAANRHSAQRVLQAKFAEMDPADAVRIAHDAHPDMPPAELASLMVSYGVVVDAVHVALILGGRPAQITVERDDADDAPTDTDDAPQLIGRPALTKKQAVLDAVAVLGPDFKAADIVERVQRINRINIDAPYVRTVLSREAKRTKSDRSDRPMEGGYA